MFKFLSIYTMTICLCLMATCNAIFSQDYSDANEIPMTALQSVTESVDQTEEAINKLEKGLNLAREFLKSPESKNIPKEKRLQIMQKIADAEYALDQSKLPLKQFKKYSGRIAKVTEVYSEVTSINENYNRRQELQGSLSANLGFVSDAMKTYGGKVPILGEAIEAYGTITSGLLDKTEQLAIDIDKKQNQGAISGQGFYKGGYGKAKYEQLLKQYPKLATDYTYLPTTPYFVYEAVEPGKPKLIWDEQNHEFYAVPNDIPIEKIFKMKLLTNSHFTPYELKVVTDKWDTVGKASYIDAITISSIFITIAKESGYSETKNILWNVRNNNQDLMRELFNDPQTFHAKYMYDYYFKQAADKAFNDFYTQLCQNPNTRDAAKNVFDILKEYNVSFKVTPPQEEKIVTNTKQDTKPTKQSHHSWNTQTKPKTKTQNPPYNPPYSPPVTYQPPKQTPPSSQTHDTKLDEYGKEKQKLINGQKICAAFMQSLTKHYNKTWPSGEVYTIEFTRPFQYEDGQCVGSYNVWVKPLDKPAYTEIHYYTPSEPARLPANQMKSAWQNKNPHLDWGN